MNKTIESVKKYYGEILKNKNDLKTSACCSAEALPPDLKEIVKEIHPEVIEKFYGCGSPIPPNLEGKTVLDLGCGTGRDCFILSKLVGENGSVIGIDMTDEQLNVANKYLFYHTKKFGYQKPNIQFIKGYIEDLESLGIKNNSVDAVVSNCVMNLSPSKPQVFAEIFRVLKPKGELFFSDVFASKKVPPHLTDDPVLVGECLGGAMAVEDFKKLLGQLGCNDYGFISETKLELNNPEIKKKAGTIEFYSITVRAFKQKRSCC